MESLAIWYQKKNDTKINADLHINFWNANKKTHKNILDIGLMINDLIGNIEEIYIYFPFVLKSEDFIDLGVKLKNDAKLLNAIFNEDLSSTNDHTPKQMLLQEKLSNKEEVHIKKFILYELDFKKNSGEISIENRNNGVILKIVTKNIKEIKNVKTVYFRFRINSPVLLSFIKEYKPKNSFLDSAYSITELLDFRLNEKRNLDSTLLQEIENNSYFSIKKIHFLVLKSANDDYIFSHKQNDSARKIEEKLWDNYIDFNYFDKNLIAYHWKEKAKEDGYIESFNAFIKFKCPKINFKTIGFYLLIFSLITIILNISSGYLKDCIDKKINKNYKNVNEKQIMGGIKNDQTSDKTN